MQELPSQSIHSPIGPHIQLLSSPHIIHHESFRSESMESSEFQASLTKNTHRGEMTSTLNQTKQDGLGLVKARKTKLRRQKQPQLKQIITEQRINTIVQNFVKKLSRNNIAATPVEFTPFFNEKQLSFLETQGMQLSDIVESLMFICSILTIIMVSIIFTLQMVFEEINETFIFKAISLISLLYFLVELGLNLVTVKFEEGKRLGSLRQILNYCGRKSLPIDLITIMVLFIDQFSDSHSIIYMRLFVILKLGQVFEKLQKLEVFFIHNFYYEQYWSLIKVFLFNFSLAHIMAIALIAMAGVNEDSNWMSYKDIYLAPWYEKYAWAYYWATAIMLTVGFGDLTATNYEEAVILALVEMISCIALAYNINCVGHLISNIRSQDLEKGKNFKVFHKLSRKNGIPQDLEWRINNYIEESSNIKKKFNYEEENLFVEKLPNGLKIEFLKESNKKIFQNLPFFKNLMERTLFSFAQKIEMHICHPEEIVQHLEDPHNLLILKGGEIGFTCKKNGCNYNSTVIDQLKILDASDPILISLGFIRTPLMVYEIKSLAYSVLYFLDFENILSILRGSDMDYELYCLLRDKSMNMPDEYELFNCEICKQKHTKFTCPKLHFIPLKQQVANKYYYKLKHDKAFRNNQICRYESVKYNPLKIYMGYNKQLEKKSKILLNRRDEISKKISCLMNINKFEPIEEGLSNTFVKQMSEIKDFFSKNTAQLIKLQMSKAFQYSDIHDEVWLIESDKMKNYKGYFEVDNSCNLIEKFCVTKRTGLTVYNQEGNFTDTIRLMNLLTPGKTIHQGLKTISNDKI